MLITLIRKASVINSIYTPHLCDSPQLSGGRRFCVSINGQSDTRKFNISSNPTYEGGINSGYTGNTVHVPTDMVGKVLRALNPRMGKSSLITEVAGVHEGRGRVGYPNSPLNDWYGRK